MQESFPQPVLPIENKISDLGRYFSRKVKKFEKRLRNQKFETFFEGHITVTVKKPKILLKVKKPFLRAI